jgi:peroxiredoxin
MSRPTGFAAVLLATAALALSAWTVPVAAAEPELAPAGDSSTAGRVVDKAEDVRPLARGAAAPGFVVRHPDGTEYRFEPGARAKPAALLFYRGGWCPFCNVHLGQLKEAEAILRQRGYDILFLSSDRPEILRSSLKDDIENETAHYTLLSDSDASAARAFGVAFRLEDGVVEQYKGYGIDLESTQGNTQHVLPVPAVFVVDRAGQIAFSHHNPDYQVRLGAEELLAAAP